MHEVLVNRLGGLSLPRKSVVRLTDRPDMTLDVYHGRKTTILYNTLGAMSAKIQKRWPPLLYLVRLNFLLAIIFCILLSKFYCHDALIHMHSLVPFD